MASKRSSILKFTLFVLMFPFAFIPQYSWGICESLDYNGGDDWYPFFYRGNQVSFGIASDALTIAAEKIKQPLEFRESMPWMRQLLELKYGRLDIIAGTTELPNSHDEFIFSPPVTYAHLTVFSRQDSQLDVTEISDLRGLRGAKLIGMDFDKEVKNFALKELILEKAMTLESLFKMLNYGRVDYVIAYEQTGLRYLKKLGLERVIISHEIALSSDSVHIMAAKKNACIKHLEGIFKQIEILKQTQQFNDVLDKYLPKPSLPRGGDQ